MLLSKFKIRSRYMALASFLLFGGLTLSWVFASHYFEIMTMDYNAPDLAGTKEEIRQIAIASISNWEVFVDSSMFHIINFIPVLFILPTLGLFTEKRSLYVLGRHRFPFPLIRRLFIEVIFQSLDVSYNISELKANLKGTDFMGMNTGDVSVSITNNSTNIQMVIIPK
ncbi:hypothetical protein [Peribacillus muralis]|uniref:hypothetical protein n=1 Tax=Peribacillus muralis TaxID=264697 RepID=UPI003D03C12C